MGDIFGEKHLNREAIVRFLKVESKDFKNKFFIQQNYIARVLKLFSKF